jgi:hypothetical protein
MRGRADAQVNDILQLGTVQEVAQVVVPPGSTVQGATQYTLVSPARPGGEEITRSYYAYKFVRGPKTSFLVAGAARGKVRKYLSSVRCTVEHSRTQPASVAF